MTKIFSATRCTLGEGALWHPARNSLFWFDILSHRLYESDGAKQQLWQFDRAVSAAGWVDADHLLVASARNLFVLDLATGTESHVADLEADMPETRSNDGRADPFGGFWIGTMGYNAEPQAGSIYRFYKGRVEKLFDKITISNAICFSPDGQFAYFTDTTRACIQRIALDAEGWPQGQPIDWLDLREDGLNPDGAVVDREGRIWNAQWGAGRVACYDAQGAFVAKYALPALQTTCPCFGGPDLSTLYVTTAARGVEDSQPDAGKTFAIATPFQGQAEHRVIM